MSILTAKSRLTFHRLRSSSPDHNGSTTYIRYDTDRGLILDQTSAAVLGNLLDGKRLGEAADKNKRSLEDAKELVQSLTESGFVRTVDQEQVDDKEIRIRPWLAFIPRRYFTWVLSPWLIVPGFIIIFAGFATAILNTKYFPSALAFFWHENLFISIAGIFITNYLLIYLHEAAHYVTTRAVGGHAKMLLDRQMASVVVATEEYHLAVLPKQAKFVTYISGLFLDMLIVSLIFILFALTQAKILSLGGWVPLLNVVLLIQFNAIVWEFGTFLTTDVYYFLTDLAGEDELKLSTRKYLSRMLNNLHHPLARAFRKLITGQGKLPPIRAENAWKYRLYIAFSTFGYVGTSIMSLLITIPKYILFTAFGFLAVSTAIPAGDMWGAAWGILTIILINDHNLSLAYLLVRDKKI